MGKAERFILLEQELMQYSKVLSQASDIILDEGVSKYPIFVGHHHDVTMGIPIVEKEKTGGKWNFNASTLEEFVAKNIVFNDKIDEFRQNFKDPEDFICVFVLSELGAKFVFIPKYKSNQE